jgi:hypothetical protein
MIKFASFKPSVKWIEIHPPRNKILNKNGNGSISNLK